jgi:DHA3 family macrolide efflux protein-like MFS transporter
MPGSYFRRPSGIWGLFFIWLGQMISGIASSITFFALPNWILETTGVKGSALSYWESAFFGAYLLIVLFAGVFIDRYNRKMMILVYDFMGLITVAILLALQTTGHLMVWHLYIAAVLQGIGFAFQAPSYSAAITTMVPRKQFARANGFVSLLDNAPGIAGPFLAVFLVSSLGLRGVLALNLLSFVLSIGTLLFVEIPATPQTLEGEMSHSRFWKEVLFGVKYIFQRPGLLGIQLVFLFGNFFTGIALSLTALYTMVFLRTGGNQEAANLLQSSSAAAAVIFGVIVTGYGRIKRPVQMILFGWIISSLLGMGLLGVGQSLTIWLIAVIVDSSFDPIVNVSIDTFLQTKVPPDLQGRVFSASDFLAQILIPITPLAAGVLGEKVFEPAMAEGGLLANSFGWLVGTGPGSGFGLMILFCGIGGTLVGLFGYLTPGIRNVNKTLPDYDLSPAPESPDHLVTELTPALVAPEKPLDRND